MLTVNGDLAETDRHDDRWASWRYAVTKLKETAVRSMDVSAGTQPRSWRVDAVVTTRTSPPIVTIIYITRLTCGFPYTRYCARNVFAIDHAESPVRTTVHEDDFPSYTTDTHTGHYNNNNNNRTRRWYARTCQFGRRVAAAYTTRG